VNTAPPSPFTLVLFENEQSTMLVLTLNALVPWLLDATAPLRRQQSRLITGRQYDNAHLQECVPHCCANVVGERRLEYLKRGVIRLVRVAVEGHGATACATLPNAHIRNGALQHRQREHKRTDIKQTS
jgi:hypothetical protein